MVVWGANQANFGKLSQLYSTQWYFDVFRTHMCVLWSLRVNRAVTNETETRPLPEKLRLFFFQIALFHNLARPISCWTVLKIIFKQLDYSAMYVNLNCFHVAQKIHEAMEFVCIQRSSCIADHKHSKVESFLVRHQSFVDFCCFLFNMTTEHIYYEWRQSIFTYELFYWTEIDVLPILQVLDL